MKILFFGAHFPRPNNPTIGTWALSQVVALRQAGHEVRVISPVAAIPAVVSKVTGRGTSAICPPRHRWQGIDVDYLRWPVYPVGPLARWLRDRPGLFVRPAWLLSRRRFTRAARAFAPDVIFAHHGQLSGFIAARVARALKVPFFVTEHNFNDIESCAHNAARKNHYRDLLRNVDHWIAVADRMRHAMAAIFPGIPAITVHNGAELIPPALENNPRPRELSDRVVVLCATFFYARKNVPLLIQAFDSIAGRHPEASLVVIGDGESKDAVAAAVRNANHSSQMILLGALQHREVLQHMVWCDVFAHIGIDEPFATVFSEAMMAGRPIIFCEDGGITDVAVSEVHGLSVKPSDLQSTVAALERLVSDPGLRRKLGASASALAATQLTWSQNAKNMSRLFEAAT